jgi:hypothetical protein
MSFADEWEILPDCGVPVSTRATKINNADFDREFEEFCKEQRQLKVERLTKEAETKQKAETQPTEAVAEEAYQAFVEEAEKPKSKKKKKTEEVVEETSNETPVVKD